MIKKDLIILGTGPAGLTASIYASRFQINHLLIGEEFGGYMNESFKIENYPGLPGISGAELSQKMKSHAETLGSEVLQEKIISVKKNNELFEIATHKEKYHSKTVILATGTVFRKLGVPGEEKLAGKGVSYCATCDGPFFKDKKVAVVGGGNSALNAALLLSQYAKEVAIFYRAEKLRAVPSYVKQVNKKENIETVSQTNIVEIKGEQKVEKIVLDNPYKEEKELSFDGVFVEIGSLPDTSHLEEMEIEKDERGYIKTNQDQTTNIEGLFAAGDITTNSNNFRQIITAASEGAIAAASAYQEINQGQ
ncbi:MAG: thioredoxin-disulfide reductase [Candidatus Moraniibacteriota bacterium]